MTTVSLDPPLLDLYGKAPPICGINTEAGTSTNKVSVEIFQILAYRRATIYQKILAFSDLGDTVNLRKHLLRDLDVDFPLHTLQQRARDHQAHFILRLVCGASAELRRLFVLCELTIFELRMQKMSPSWQKQFVHKWISTVYRTDGEGPLNSNQTSSTTGRHWLIPFEDCEALVRRRRVEVKGGTAFVPKTSALFSEGAHTNSEGTPAFAVLRQTFRNRMREAAEISSRARPLFDVNESLSLLHTIIAAVQRLIVTPFSESVQRVWRRRQVRHFLPATQQSAWPSPLHMAPGII